MKTTFIALNQETETYTIFTLESASAKTYADMCNAMTNACSLMAAKDIHEGYISCSNFITLIDDAETSAAFKEMLRKSGLSFEFVAEGFDEQDIQKFKNLYGEPVIMINLTDTIPLKLDVVIDSIEWDTDGEFIEGLPDALTLHLKSHEKYLVDILSDKYGFCVFEFKIRKILVNGVAV